ncbi:MAG: hypothetical protein OEY00_13915 [Gammaproteobacteria bacterium]|nr:hypothetical protein [Gammaproteobacteria bacterium]
MPAMNPQDGNVGNLGDVLKHAALVQLAKLFAEHMSGEKYYLDSHSYLYQSNLVNTEWRQQTAALRSQSVLYQDYIDLETAYINQGEYLCSSGIVNKIIPDAHLLLCESNRSTREWLLQQLADNKVTYHTVKAQLVKWAKRKSFKKLPNLLMLLDPFELTDSLWKSVNRCIGKMLDDNAEAIILVFDYTTQTDKVWPVSQKRWQGPVACISMPPYRLAAYATEQLRPATLTLLLELGWSSCMDMTLQKA